MRTPEEIKDEVWPQHKCSTAWIDKFRVEVIRAVIPWFNKDLEIKLTESFNAGAIVGEEKGMQAAADIVTKYAVDLGRTPVNGMRFLIEDGRGDEDEVRKTYKQAILSAAEKVGKG